MTTLLAKLRCSCLRLVLCREYQNGWILRSSFRSGSSAGSGFGRCVDEIFSSDLRLGLYPLWFYRIIFGCAGGQYPTLGGISKLECGVVGSRAFSCRDRLAFCVSQQIFILRLYLFLAVVEAFVFMFSSPWLPQRFHPAIYPLVVLLLWRSFIELRRKVAS